MSWPPSTGGNNGYVENVCNGRSGIFDVITMVSNINQAEFMILSTGSK